MGLYKVTFKDNTAITATQMPGGYRGEIKEFGLDGTTKVINWYIVDAENEAQAIEIADLVVRRIWGKVLGLQ